MRSSSFRPDLAVALQVSEQVPNVIVGEGGEHLCHLTEPGSFLPIFPDVLEQQRLVGMAIELMRMTREEWDRWTRGSAIRRAGYAGFKRNVAVAIGNWSAAEVAEGNWLASVDEVPEDALAVLRDAIEHDEPLVGEHAARALKQVR